MLDYRNTGSKRLASGIIGIMMLIIMLFSAFYIASEAVHDCCDDDCPICSCIQFCKNTLHQVCLALPDQVRLLLFVGIILLLKNIFEVLRPHESLISMKIRMNN